MPLLFKVCFMLVIGLVACAQTNLVCFAEEIELNVPAINYKFEIPAKAQKLFQTIDKLQKESNLKSENVEELLDVHMIDGQSEVVTFDSSGLFNARPSNASGIGAPFFDRYSALVSAPTSSKLTIYIPPDLGITTQLMKQYFGTPSKTTHGNAYIVDYQDGCEHWSETLYVYARSHGYTVFRSLKYNGATPFGSTSRGFNFSGNVITSVQICDHGSYSVFH